MKKVFPWVLLVVAAVAVAWFVSVYLDMQEIEQAEVLQPPPLTKEPEPVRFPVEDIAPPPRQQPEIVLEPVPEPEPLPTLEESDPVMLEAMAELVSDPSLADYLAVDLMISRVVATVDSLDSSKVAPLMLPVRQPPGNFVVLSAGDEAVVSPDNASRYQPYVDLAVSIDAQTAVGLYQRYYPLFQEAFEAQGYPEAYFNDRLVEVIDHLLETPEPVGMLDLVQVEAVYEYTDESLESLSAGQKMLLRLDNEQSRLIRDRLRQVRDLVTGLEASGQ